MPRRSTRSIRTLFSGGSDLDPETYGQEAHAETNGVVPERDSAEIALLQAALERDMPVLGSPGQPGAERCARGRPRPASAGRRRRREHKHTPGVFADHDVDVLPGTRVQRILGDHAPVKSHHHQGYGRLGEGAPGGSAPRTERSRRSRILRRFALGVLWHPEVGEDFALFEALVEEATQYHQEHG